MINTTEEIISIISSAELHREIGNAVSEVIKFIALREQKRRQYIDITRRSFETVLGTSNLRANIVLDVLLLQSLLKLSQSNSQNTGLKTNTSTIKNYVLEFKLPAQYMNSFKYGVRVMLLKLWDKGCILLPSAFTTGPHFSFEIFNNIILKWILTFDPAKDDTIGGKGNKSEHRRIFYYCPRLLFSTNWKSPEDVSLLDISSLHRAQRLYQNDHTLNPIAGNQIPYSAFAANLLQKFPDKVQFDKDDLSRYSLWILMCEVSKIEFVDFNPLKLEQYNKSNSIKAKIPKIKTGKVSRKPLAPSEFTDILKSSEVDVYEALADRWVKFSRFRSNSMDWRIGTPSYPGREHIDLSAIAPIWIEAFKAYMYQRTNIQEYREEKLPISALNILADYLFYYLPWWKELSPTSLVTLPNSPRYFTRYTFVTRTTDGTREMLPATLFNLIETRRPNKNSASAVKRQLIIFFHFIETNYADNELYAGTSFRSPVSIEFDIPKSEKPGKTNKVIFPKDIYGYLLHWFYAIETFGSHLEKLALSGNFSETHGHLRNARRFECKQFNIISKFKYRNKEYELTSIPNVFTWANRQLNDDKNIRIVYLPHCSSLRMLITSYETGLRCQSIQWLDRISWSSLLKNYPNDSYTFPLLVNTDKTLTKPWSTPMVYRVKDMLQREQDFQERFKETASIPPVPYENNLNSPFELISPLFRGVNSPNPINDNKYNADWKLLMIEFEFFFREIFKDSHLEMFKLVPMLDVNNSNPIIHYQSDIEKRPYCPITISVINTPHSCRASFITNRKGLMELSELAEQVGHASIIVTSHYDRPSGDDLHERLKNTDLSLFGDWKQFDKTTGVHIRADQPNSSLITNFKKNRIGTISEFRFMSPIPMWTLEDMEKGIDGLAMLKDGPMSHIRFRETHICPVGEECPSDILERIGEARRCGCCPLAMKCIDHLTAISAKCNQLVERIKFRQKQRVQMEKVGEPTSALDEVWEAMEMDINELLGWKQSEDILSSLLETSKDTDALKFMHVDKPDIVRNHISRISRQSNEAEFILQRIADSNAYPSFSTPQVQTNSAKLKKRLLAGKNDSSLSEWNDDFDDIQTTAHMLGLMMRAKQLNISDVAKHINSITPFFNSQNLLEKK